MSSSKKVLFIIIVLCFAIIQLLATSVIAATINMQLQSNKEQYEIDNETTIEVQLSLADFDNISENTVLGCYAEIEYDKELLSLEGIEGQNGWNVDFNRDTNKLVLDTDSAKSNTVIAKIVFNININEIKKDEKVDIVLKNLVLTDGNFKINSQLQTEIKIIASKTNKDDIQRVEEVYTESGQKITNSKIASLDETTLKNRILPYVGNEITIFILIGILLILIIIFKIKSRKIKY